MGGLFLGVIGLAAFLAVLVALPPADGDKMLPLLCTGTSPRACSSDWVLELVLTGGFFGVFFLPSILAELEEREDSCKRRQCSPLLSWSMESK